MKTFTAKQIQKFAFVKYSLVNHLFYKGYLHADLSPAPERDGRGPARQLSVYMAIRALYFLLLYPREGTLARANMATNAVMKILSTYTPDPGINYWLCTIDINMFPGVEVLDGREYTGNGVPFVLNRRTVYVEEIAYMPPAPFYFSFYSVTGGLQSFCRKLDVDIADLDYSKFMETAETK